LSETFDVVVLGGGAAGLMCAAEAGKRGRKVGVLERSEKVGKKVLISGGGRCNFTNLHCRPEHFLSANPHFAKSALARYTPEDFLALVRKYGIPYHEKTLGQLFCDRSARDIVHLLESECREANVKIFTNLEIQEIAKDGKFRIRTSAGELQAQAIVVATGGLSIPKMGATGFGYDLARQFGLKMQETRPGLVPLVLRQEDCVRLCDLTGVSAEVVASYGTQKFREKMLFTHRGISGPAILQISSYSRNDAVTIDLVPGRTITSAWKDPKTPRTLASARTTLQSILPKRLADRWIELYPPQAWSNAALQEWEKQIHHWQIHPAGTEGYGKAEVTTGGVDTNELSAKTMESKKVPGLYFIGEVVDVTGHLGGFNFQWAWASGAAAGRAV
jgi:predicted Rossmann fold flavoprotein